MGTLELHLHKAATNTGAKVTLSFSPVGFDKARFEVQVNRLGWIGFGISTGTTGLMIGGGLGTDAVICSDGQVKRHWLWSYSGPGEGSSEDLESASCDQANGYTTLTFTRSIAAANVMQRALTPGTAQPVVVAWGVGQDKASAHGAKQGMQDVDFGKEDSLVSAARARNCFFVLSLLVTFIAV